MYMNIHIYIYIDPRGAPVGRCPLCFSAACVIGQVWYRSLFVDMHWVCHGNSLSDRVSAGFTSALYSPD